jgi:hypothetical protein
MAQGPSATTLLIDLPSNSHHPPEPVVASTHGQVERVTGLPDRPAFNEHEAMELGLFRLRPMIDAAPEASVDHEASLAIRIHAPPASCTRTVPSAALCLASAEKTRRVGYRRSDAIPCKKKIE